MIRNAVLFCAVAIPVSAASVASATWGVEPIKMSYVRERNLMPSFYFMEAREEGGAFKPQTGYHGGLGSAGGFTPADNCPDELFDNTMKSFRVPAVPYLEQDDWGCEALSNGTKPSNVPAIVAETDELRAAITPQWGGKIWSLYNKKLKRQLLFNNPAHQPDNIGYLKAWTSGGAEWNWSPGYIGHSASSEAPVWAAVIPTEKGDVVRVWEFDRLNATAWQVDILLEDDVLWTHIKIYNPNPTPIDGYWWTCVAMPVTPRTRVVAQADISSYPCAPWPYGVVNGNGQNGNTSFRALNPQDMSFIGNNPGSVSE